MMGVISSQLLVTGSERRGKRKKIQPGNREWVTVINSIGAAGWAIPPFIIFAGKVHISSWYENDLLPHDWVIELSNNGWTTNELGIAWLKHFNKHTKARTKGTHRLLVIDGHESHHSIEFDRICKEEKIIALCMPSHASHLLQPLDVGCFSPLKTAYGNGISALARNHTNHIAKETFLPAFKTAFNKAFTKENICASFRGAGLVPHEPEVVLSKLDLRLRTPTPAVSEDLPWQSHTPSNAREIEAQSTLIRDRIRQHKSSSPASIIESINRLEKGSAKVMHDFVLLREEMASLRQAAETATKRKSRKRRYIHSQETRTVGEMTDLITPTKVDAQEEGKKPRKRVQKARHCGRCGNTGHNSRTCKV
jgi:DDE superfamily endonuclease